MKKTEMVLKKSRFSLEHVIQILGKVGQGRIKLYDTVLDIDSELTQKTKSILKLFSGH